MIMKNVLTTLTIATALMLCYSFTTLNNDVKIYEKSESTGNYLDGWKEGYCEGWKYIKGQFALCPITPIAPLPPLGCVDLYKCGYNDGFIAGMQAAREQ